MSEYAIKLVRDDIAKVVPNAEQSGVYFKPVGRTTHINLLEKKLAEEVAEYLVDGGADELADIMEVVEALARVAEGCGPAELRSIKVEKLRKRGGFFGGTAMFSRPEELDRG